MPFVDTPCDGQAAIVYDAIHLQSVDKIPVNIKFASLKQSRTRKKLRISTKTNY